MYSKFLESPESAVLGAILHDPSLLAQVESKVRSQDFRDPVRGIVFSVIQRLAGSGVTPTPDAVNAEMAGMYPLIASEDYLAELMDRCPSLDVEAHVEAIGGPELPVLGEGPRRSAEVHRLVWQGL